MKPENLKEFKALKKRYESITLEEIKEKIKAGLFVEEVASKLTGFGDSDTCSLCKVCSPDCFDCIYYTTTMYSCSDENNYETYRRIQNANTPVKLLNAFRARAKHMKTLINLQS